MSGLNEARTEVRKPMLTIAASAAIGVAGMGALWWASASPRSTEGSALQPACIALAIDRTSGQTTKEPCPGTPMLIAETQDRAQK